MTSSGPRPRSRFDGRPDEAVGAAGAAASRAPGAAVGGAHGAAARSGARAGARPGLRIVALTPSGVRESIDADDLAALVADPANLIWVDLTDPTPAVVERVASALGLHPLVAEDIVERNQRAKIEFDDDSLHLVLFGLIYTDEVRLTEIDLVLGGRFLLSAHEAAWDPDAVDGLRLGADRALRQGADFLLWALADGVVDAYFPVLDRIDEELDRLEDDVIDRTDRESLQRLFVLKRELIELRRAIVPTRETVGQLTNRQLPLVAPEHLIYFRDVYDHLIRAAEDLDTLRDLASSTLEVYLSQVNNNLSLIMKRLTGVTVILAGIGAAAGIFGMSEAGAAFAGGERTGFWLVTVGVVALAVLGAYMLRRIGWI